MTYQSILPTYVAEYILPDPFVAVAADRNSVDSVCFIKVIKSNLQSIGGDTHG